MLFPGRQDGSACRRGLWRSLLMLLVLVALVTQLATRYVYVSAAVDVPILKSGASEAKHQNLHKDGLKWTPPVSEFTLFVSATCAPPTTAVMLAVTRYVDEPLYNRPPPSSC